MKKKKSKPNYKITMDLFPKLVKSSDKYVDENFFPFYKLIEKEIIPIMKKKGIKKVEIEDSKLKRNITKKE